MPISIPPNPLPPARLIYPKIRREYFAKDVPLGTVVCNSLIVFRDQDGIRALDCTFINCSLIFTGQLKDIRFDSSRFYNCSVSFPFEGRRRRPEGTPPRPRLQPTNPIKLYIDTLMNCSLYVDVPRPFLLYVNVLITNEICSHFPVTTSSVGSDNAFMCPILSIRNHPQVSICQVGYQKPGEPRSAITVLIDKAGKVITHKYSKPNTKTALLLASTLFNTPQI